MPSLTLSGLIERRAATAAELNETRDRAAVLTAALAQLDRMIARTGYNGDPSTIRPRRLIVAPGPRERGPLVRPVLTILRLSERPLTLREITLRVIQGKGLDGSDARVLRTSAIR